MAEILQQPDGVIIVSILAGGNPIQDTVEILEISVQKEINRITMATIIIQDGAAIGLSNDPFQNSEGNDFIPGNEIEIKVGYESKTDTVFKGIIISQGISLRGGNPQLVITCKDKSVKMTKGRFNAIFQKKKDSDAISEIAGKYGLTSSIAATNATLPVLMQYNCSDWDFVVIRAEMNNMMVLTDQNSLTVKKIDFSTSPQIEINATQYVIDIDLHLDSESIAGAYKLIAWDEASQKEAVTSVTLNDGLSQGNLTAKKLSEAVDNGDSNHYSSSSLSQDELKSWGDSFVNKAVLSKIQGKITVPGTSKILPGDLVTLSGFSARFNGNAFISKVIHTIQAGEWLTTVHVGRSPQWHSSLPDVEENKASGLLPATNGAQIAKVIKIEEDPDGNFRVLVTLPTFTGTGQTEGIWARIAFPYASSKAGFFFFPEVGDEVLLTFINNDPRYAVITGALYSTKNVPKETPNKDNQFKSIFSKSGIKVQFDDKDKILIIDTPGGNSFTLDDKNKKIEIKDLNSNKVTMDQNGISLDSSKDIKLNAKGNIDLTSTQNTAIKASGGDVKAEGLNVQLTAQVGMTAKGNASAEISASGTTTVKGAMVMIN